MRWSMLPVSVAVHATAVFVLFIIPLAADVELPAPWPQGGREFVAVQTTPPSSPIIHRVVTPLSDAAPIAAPDTIANDPPDTGRGSDVDGALPTGDPAAVGMPAGFGGTGVVVPEPPAIPLPPKDQIFRPGGAIREPRKIVDVPPVYPQIARDAKVEGLVIVEATIDERGMVTDARVLRSVALLDGAALTAVRQWRYTPTLLNGVPVRVLMTVTFNFRLSQTP